MTMSFPRVPALLCASLALTVGCDDVASPAGTPFPHGFSEVLRLKLPDALREISGLAVAGPDTLLAVDDEQALVYRIDLATQVVEPLLAIGRPARPGDYEGLARIGDQTLLVDSDGVLFWTEGERVQTLDTRLGARFEIEGLGRDPVSGLLYLASKRARGKGKAMASHLHAVDLPSRARQPDADIELDLAAAQQALSSASMHLSGLAFSDDGQNIWLVAARERALLNFDRAGQLRSAIDLSELGKHRQAEGIALLPGGRLAIADEGDGKRARLTVYRFER
jgi:hypothetical protein